MSLTKEKIGKALDDAGVTGEQRKIAEQNLIRSLGSDYEPMKPWKFPAFSLKSKNV